MNWIKRIILWFAPWLCRWHKGDSPATYDAEGQLDGEVLAYCPDCGSMLWLKPCPRCGKEFIAWGDEGFDDVCAGALVSESGDVCCRRCYRPDKYEDVGDYDEDGEYPEDAYTDYEGSQ